MLIYAIESDPVMLEGLKGSIAAAAPDAVIEQYLTGEEALAALDDDLPVPDAVFSAIRLAGMDGLELAGQLRTRVPGLPVIFVTGYTEYALEAYRRHINGYVIKPATPERIREELDAAGVGVHERTEKDKLIVRCFGHFEVFYKGKPVIFRRRQSKELFAYLIDCGGRSCTSEEIAAVLWEDDDDMESMKMRIRRIISDLKATFAGIGMEDVLIREHRQIAVRLDLIDCDYYRVLMGVAERPTAAQAQYMIDYSWAEPTNALLYFQN